MSDRVYGADEKAKLERLVNEGATVMQEVEDLTQGLKETVKAIAEELDIKPALINKAIKVAHKGDSFAPHCKDHMSFPPQKESRRAQVPPSSGYSRQPASEYTERCFCRS